MALTIKWTKEARSTYQDVLDYLDKNWTEKELRNFIKRTEALLQLISHHPHIFKASRYKSIRKAVIGKQNSLIYRIDNSTIYVLTFWDNRQDPAKNKY